MPQLVIITGPIAAGKNTVAGRLTHVLPGSVVVADVDTVAEMVGPPGASEAGLWPAAHEAHAALVGAWMHSPADYVVVVGPFYTAVEQATLLSALPPGTEPLWVIIEAPVSVTLPRAEADPTRGISKVPEAHHRMHKRYRKLRPTIPADVIFDSSAQNPDEIAAAIARRVTA